MTVLVDSHCHLDFPGLAERLPAVLDDMAANYPSVQLVSFSIDTRSFADTDGSAVTATAFNVSLNVILCDKGGVQP